MQQVIVGLDTAEMLSELESLSESEIDFEFDEFDAEDNDVDDESDDEDEDDDSYSQVATHFLNIWSFNVGSS